jgi:hypothetical protein
MPPLSVIEAQTVDKSREEHELKLKQLEKEIQQQGYNVDV